MAYEPRDPPIEIDEILAEYIVSELREIAAQFRQVEQIRLVELHVAPDKPRDGDIVLADGTDFEPLPAQGGGFFGRSAGAWVKLG
jgi:hypothetical protein